MSVNFGRSLSIEEVEQLLEDGLVLQNPRSDDKVERVFKLDEPYLMKLLRQVVMVLSWTLMLGEAAKQHYNKYCRPQEFDHEHIHVKVQASQEKRMILITTFIRIFSIIRSKIDEIKLDAKCSSDWSQLSDDYIKEIMEKDLHAGYRKSFVCGLDIIYSFCQNCALRCFTDNLLVEFMQRVRLCRQHTTLIDKLSALREIVQLLDKAPQGQKLLYVLEVVWGSSCKCTLCRESGLLSVEFFKRSRHKSDCSTCELLVLDSIFSALVYAEAPKRMFAALAFSIDEFKCTHNFKATAHEVGLTKWLPRSETSIWDVLFISGYNSSDEDCFKRWLQFVLKGRSVRLFFIYFESQSLKLENKAQRYCTEPQILQYTELLKRCLHKEAIDLTCMISSVILEQTMCSVCDYLVKEWPEYLFNKMIFIQLYHSQSTWDTFLARLDPIIQLRSLPPSEHRNSQDLMHYDCVSNIASIWIWPTGRFNEYYISTSEIASGYYTIQENNKVNERVSPCTYYCTTGRYRPPCMLEEGFYRIARDKSFYWFMRYPTNSSYAVVKVEGANNRYLLTSDQFSQQITQRRIMEIDDWGFRLPQHGVYYIVPFWNPSGFHMIEENNTLWEYYAFIPIKHVHYEFQQNASFTCEWENPDQMDTVGEITEGTSQEQSKRANRESKNAKGYYSKMRGEIPGLGHNTSESVASCNGRNVKELDGNMDSHDEIPEDTAAHKQVRDNEKTVENVQNEGISEDLDSKSEENAAQGLQGNEQEENISEDMDSENEDNVVQGRIHEQDENISEDLDHEGEENAVQELQENEQESEIADVVESDQESKGDTVRGKPKAAKKKKKKVPTQNHCRKPVKAKNKKKKKKARR